MWALKAKLTDDRWVRFVLYWMIFDGYLTEMSGSGSDEKKLQWFFNNENEIKSLIPGCWGLGSPYAPISFVTLCNFAEVKDMRPGSIKVVRITDRNNIEEVIRFIYQIRCNLFHGAKNVNDPKDDGLVFYSGALLKSLIESWLAKF